MKTTFIYRQRGKDAMYKIWHELGNRIMFLYVNDGSGSVVGHERVYPLKKGALYFIGAKKSHYTMPENLDKYDRNKLFIPIESFHSLCAFCDQNARFKEIFANDKLVYAQIPASEQKKIDILFSELQAYQADDRHREAILLSACARLLAYVDQYAVSNLSTSSSTNFVFHAIEYINEHISQPLTVEEVSDAVFMSKYYFCRKFKTVTGLSVMEYILSTRLSLAQEMLLNGKMTVSDISDRCGFSSVAYFCNVFKQRMGKSPLQYRKHATIIYRN